MAAYQYASYNVGYQNFNAFKLPANKSKSRENSKISGDSPE